MSTEIKIEGLVIKLGSTQQTISIEEAKQLYKTLDELFGKEIVHVHHDNWYWRYPHYTYCTTSGATASLSDVVNCSSAVLTLGQ